MTSGDGDFSGLADALREEERWVERLAGVVREHRESLVRSDALGAETAVFAVNRVVATLLEARRRRALLLAATTGREGVELDELDLALDGEGVDDVVRARDTLQASARRLQGEVLRNRRLLVELRVELESYLDLPQDAPSGAGSGEGPF